MPSVEEVARALGFEALGDGSLTVEAAAHPSSAGDSDLALAMDPKFVALLKDCSARVAMVPPDTQLDDYGLQAAIVVARPRFGLAGVTALFAPEPDAPIGVHPSAVVDPSAQIDPTASIGALCVIGAGAVIGARTRLLPHCTIAEKARIGDDGLLHSGVRVGARVHLGNRAIVHSNAVLGSDGFSFVTPEPGAVESAKAKGVVAMGAENRVWARIHSLGAVRIGDDVEIGAAACIDRGTVIDTTIGSGTKIDNQVQIGHNVQIGENCLLCGQVGIAGSAEIGDRCVLGGKAGLADHAKVGHDVVIAAYSGVSGSVSPRSVVMGLPAGPRATMVPAMLAMRRLPQLLRDVTALKKRFPEEGGGG